MVWHATVYYRAVRTVLLGLFLVSCVPGSSPEAGRWIDLDDLLEGRAHLAEIGYPLPWDRPDVQPRSAPDRSTEVVHGCLLLPLSGDFAELGRHGLQGAVLAYEERSFTEPPRRQVAWHVVDTVGSEQLAIEGADACLLRGALLVVTPPRASSFDFLAGGLMDRGAGVFVPVAGLTDVRRLDDRFVFVRPPLAASVGKGLAEAALARRDGGVGAALILDSGGATEAVSAWHSALEAGDWRSLPARALPGPEPEPWRTALHEVVAAGATDVLVVGTHTGNRPIIEEMSREAMSSVHLWFLEGRVHDSLLFEAEFRRALDRVHFLVGRAPNAAFSRRYVGRWREAPEVGAAEVYEAVVRAFDAAEGAEFLEPSSLAATARASLGPSAWDSAERIGRSGVDSVAAAGYESAFMRRKTAPSWIWEQTLESEAATLRPRLRPLGPSHIHHRPSGFSIESRSIGTKPGRDALVGDPHVRCVPSDDGRSKPGGNQSPDLSWSTPPQGTKSLALLTIDPDAPEDSAPVNQKGRVLPRDSPRRDFYHWVVIDIPPEVREIPAGASAPGAGELGPKQASLKDFGREGANDFTLSASAEESPPVIYGGWDGPCPPWNDERMHRLGFHLYALDVERLELTGSFDGRAVEAAMAGHVLAEVSLTGLYFISPSLDLPPVPERAGF
jgi:Raf kinase inhibitor-like YbhB/YbcL family protein